MSRRFPETETSHKYRLIKIFTNFQLEHQGILGENRHILWHLGQTRLSAKVDLKIHQICKAVMSTQLSKITIQYIVD